MAFTNDQNEPKLPISNSEKRNSSDLLPRYYRTNSNKKFLQATLDQLIQPGSVRKINGYMGRQTAKAVKTDDIFVTAVDTVRQNYQFEPAAIIQDYLGNTTFFKDYIDHINHIETNDGIVSNHNRLNSQEFYSWDPHICWDKFVNYQQYYWLPFGPSTITIFGADKAIQSTYTVEGVDETDNVAYLFTPNGLTRNPTLKLFRGQTYNFEINAPGHPFSIKSARSGGSNDRYVKGVTGIAVQEGIITFEVPLDAPNVLFYVSENSVDTGGVFQILDIEENTVIDLNADFLGKKEYIIPNGTAEGLRVSNGMKVRFGGEVIPSNYADGAYYIEGVGTAIRIVAERALEIRSTFSADKSILFDDTPFDQLPFSEVGTYPVRPDYVTISRTSPDQNPWSRYNRWFHQDVIIASAQVIGEEPNLDQNFRATRPIIEFRPGIKLFNYGHAAKTPVDVIDTFTKDIFSTIEGSLGYNIDGIDLIQGMRVLFTADTDSLVKNKIYKVNFIDVTPQTSELLFDATQVNPALNTITFGANHGLTVKSRVVYNNVTLDSVPGLTHRQVYYVNVIDAVTIELYTKPDLSVRVDILAKGEGTHKFELFKYPRKQIYLEETQDSSPVEYETVTVNLGIQNQSKTFWFDGTSWKAAQEKTAVNQAPLFDIFDDSGVSFSDLTKYSGSTFAGNKIFSYKTGVGSVDTVLGFALTYQNINNIGDILFNFNLASDPEFKYKLGSSLISKSISNGFLKIIDNLDSIKYENGWIKNVLSNVQPIVRTYKNETKTVVDENGVRSTVSIVNDFPLDVFDTKDGLEDLLVKVYVNGTRLIPSKFSIVDDVVYKLVRLTTDAVDSMVTIECFTKKHKNQNGYYKLPINLENNPLNNNIQDFTLGEVIDHVDSIIGNNPLVFFNNGPKAILRDAGRLSEYGTRFVQHTGPMNLSLYHLGNKSANLLKALDTARTDYAQFKRAFIIAASDSGFDAEPRRHVDFILQNMFANKPKSSPYYLSDMFGYTAANRTEYTVLDARTTSYPLSQLFNLKTLSNRAVGVYLNDVQLVHGRDYVFGDTEFVTLLAELSENDIIEVYEYESTDGCFVPPTPSKLGLYPLFEPSIYVDDTYIEPVKVIQGHDGSITIAFDDYRDDLILELEKRIFNNVKVSYDTELFNIFNYIPSYSRENDYTVDEFNSVLSKYFYQWTLNIQEDYSRPLFYDRENAFTYNYRDHVAPDGRLAPAYWRGIYKWFFDTDTPHLTPWESLGFFIEPIWWQDVYGPAPYTSDNLVLWDDLKEGLIREPGKPPRLNKQFARLILDQGPPVDTNGILLDPLNAGYVAGLMQNSTDSFYVFGDQGPVEAAWRKSSYYPFALISTILLLKPNDILGRCIDRSRIVKNNTGQLVYSETGLRIRLQDLIFPSVADEVETDRRFTSGLVNYVVEYLTSKNTARLTQYKYDLASLTNKMSTRLGSYTNKEKFKILLDSKTPTSAGGVFVPEENYSVSLNTSSAIRKVIYSGILITRFSNGYEVKGYNTQNPYFIVYKSKLVDRVIKVGGISESFLEWKAGEIYTSGKIVRYNNLYYRAKTTHTASTEFDDRLYARLAELPIIGGREIELKKNFNANNVDKIPYGKRIATVQEVVDIIMGYGAYLEDQGFVFDDFNNNLGTVTNWETSAKEFAFWTTQNWAEGSVLSISPSANKLIFQSQNSVVADLTDNFYTYSVLRVDGQKLDEEFIKVYRNENQFVIEPENTNYGIYGITLHLIQKEHVVVLDNKTLFNDTIYDIEAGYHQERIKVIGYIAAGWTGGFEIKGFIYDEAKIQEWEPWTDYNLGDIVKYKQFYYAAKERIQGVREFNDDTWVILEETPKSQLLPNWDYRAEQFTDFYDLDTDNFDAGQQKVAQHLIGYQKRQYLENIIQNDVSQYKFYQGMIIEKGTQNVLNKLFDVLSADGQESLTFDEEWAFRVGEYGAVDTFDEVEFILDENKFKINPQPVELVDSIDINEKDFVYRYKPTDVYVKPLSYTNNIWPTYTTNRFLRTSGYVRVEDVKATVRSIANVITLNVNDFSNGDYIWAAFESRDWSVYRFSLYDLKVKTVAYENSSKQVTVTSFALPPLAVGDIIGIKGTEKLNGFHKVTVVNGNQFKFVKDVQGWQSFADADTIVTYKVFKQRSPHITTLNSYLPDEFKPNELAWIDSNQAGNYIVYKNNPVYRKDNLVNLEPANSFNFGRCIAIDGSGNLAAVATAEYVALYQKGSSDNSWSLFDRITDVVATTLKFSHDGSWLAVGVPTHDSDKGQVQIYFRQKSGTFEINATLIGQTAGDKFGSSLAWSTTGNEYRLFVAATGYTSNTGRAYYYNYTNVGWSAGTSIPAPAGISTNEYFGFDIACSNTGKILVISAPGDGLNSGQVFVYEFNSGYTSPVSFLGLNQERLGQSVALSNDGLTLAIGAARTDVNGKADVGEIRIYKYINTGFVHDPAAGIGQVLRSPREYRSEQFGTDIGFLNDDKSLYSYSVSSGIDATLFDSNSTTFDSNLTVFERTSNENKIDIFDLLDSTFIFGETITPTSDAAFVGSISGTTLTVTDVTLGRIEVGATIYGSNLTPVKIISNGTGLGLTGTYTIAGTRTFVSGSLTARRIVNITSISGYKNTLLLSFAAESDIDRVVSSINYTSSGRVYSYVKSASESSWQKHYEQIPSVDVTKIKKVYLYSTETGKLIKYLDVVDPIYGKIPGIADQEIKYKTYFDPANYSVGTDSVNVDETANWTKSVVGALWWDLSTARFTDPQSGDVNYRTTNWNEAHPFASIDVYEWVESSILPSQWNKLSGTDKGLSQGITGTTKYDDSVYSVKKRYDSVSQTFKETYYFWVKNKTTVPNVEGRNLTALDVAKIIADPTSYGYSYIAFTGPNSFSLVNCKKYLNAKNVAVNIQYWKSEYKESNYHSEWKLLSTNRSTEIPYAIEQKWFHSLVGRDENGRLVPDISLPEKKRYGIEFRPRQGMFANRIEALKQFVERVNMILKDKLLADDYDLSALQKFEMQPTVVSGLWDQKIDTEEELRFVQTTLIRQAVITPVLLNGRIVSANIVDSGKNYGRLKVYKVDVNNDPLSWYGPSLTVTGSGQGAALKSVIDAEGKIIEILIENSGEGYSSGTRIVVRNFCVLVQSDSTNNDTWTIYTWDPINRIWSKIKSQSYDVRKYWSYINWYGSYTDPTTGIVETYNEFTKIDYLVNNTYELITTEIPIGSIVKVANLGSGGWVLFKKIAQSFYLTENNYVVVGRQNGSIQFSSSLYKFATNTLGYDGPLYDTFSFDGNPESELRIILNTLKSKILVDELQGEYLKLFFAGVRYALTEQIYVDWAFKTSFVKGQHNVGELKQKVTYNSDNLEFFEEYIKEVKPYRTKIREFVSNYNAIDPSKTFISDFDLLPTVTENYQIQNKSIIVGEDGVVTSQTTNLDNLDYFNNFTVKNIGFSLIEIKILDAGNGYVTPPVVKITGVGVSTNENNQKLVTINPTAKAYISNGKINRIEITNYGGYFSKAPTVEIKGGLSSTGTQAKAIAVIGNPLIRSNQITVKFDRISGTYLLADLIENETFSGNIISGSKTQFPLRWSPEIEYGKSFVTINGVELLRSDYKLSTVTSTNRGYTSYSGLITFTSAPAAGSVITIEYTKNFNHLSATDRINYYYNPVTGQFGKDLDQLMQGVDYGGATISGIDLGINYGWNAVPWGVGLWDNYNPKFTDYISTVTQSGITEFRLPYVPSNNQQVNIYVSRFNVSLIDSITVFNSESNAVKIVTQEDHKLDLGATIIIEGIVKADPSDPDPNCNGIHTVKRLVSGKEFIIILENTPQLGIGGYVWGNKYDTPVRIDDPYYNTPLQTNTDAVMLTFTGNNAFDIINVPTSVNLQLREIQTTVYAGKYGDRIIFRKQESDGSYPMDEDTYDTQLSGGLFANGALTSATGLAPDDIVLDGDDFVSVERNGGTEELVPGQINDTLSVKVYHRPSGGCPNIMFKNHVADGASTGYLIGQYFGNATSVIVKIDDQIKKIEDDYTINYQNNKIEFTTIPSTNQIISIISIGFVSSDMLDTDYFVGDGVTKEFITKAGWFATATAIVLVNGEPAEYSLFSTDDEYTDKIDQSWRSRVGIQFATPPAVGAVINYIIDSGNIENNATIVKSEEIVYLTGQSTYNLSNRIGTTKPYDQNVLVKQGQNFLTPRAADYFTMTNNLLSYSLKDHKYDPSLINTNDVKVYIDEKELVQGPDFNVELDYTIFTYEVEKDSVVPNGGTGYAVGNIIDAVGGDQGISGSPVKLEVTRINQFTGEIQDVIVVGLGVYVTPPASPFAITGGSGTGGTITANFVVRANPPNITVILNQTTYQEGKDFVVVIDNTGDYTTTTNSITFKNTYPNQTKFEVISFYNHNILDVERTVDTLVPIIQVAPGTPDFYELAGKLGGNFRLRKTAVSGDFVWVIKNNKLLSNNIDYYLEKDHITIRLKDYLLDTDAVQIIAFTNTVVHESFGYMQFKDILNRVHYKRLNKNKATSLTENLYQGDNTISVADSSKLDDPNPAKNIPGIIEINGERIEYFIKTGNKLSQLRRGTLGTGLPTYHEAGSIIQGIGASETIPYKDTEVIKTGNAIDDPLLYSQGILELPYIPKLNEIEVFVGGRRLRKSEYTEYLNTEYPYSPEGDQTVVKEFNTTGTTRLQLTALPIKTLTNGAKVELKVVVVKKQGRLWNDLGQRLAKSTNTVANFLKDTPSVWPNKYQDKY